MAKALGVPRRQRYWRLDHHPVGRDFATALNLHEEAPAPLNQGAVRIGVRWLSMEAGTRMWMTPRIDGYQTLVRLEPPGAD